MIEIRFHGRGGQGSVTAAEILAKAAFKDGKYVPVTNEEYIGYVKKHCEFIENREIIKTRDISVKKQPLIKRLFPDYYTMVRLYPSLEKVPVLLPGAWVARLVKKTFKRGEK